VRYLIEQVQGSNDMAAEAYALADVSGRLALEPALLRNGEPIEIVEGTWRGEC
jgi:hypothetical protein